MSFVKLDLAHRQKHVRRQSLFIKTPHYDTESNHGRHLVAEFGFTPHISKEKSSHPKFENYQSHHFKSLHRNSLDNHFIS